MRLRQVDKLLVRALEAGNLRGVAATIDAGANVDLKIDEMPLLHFMVLQQQVDMVDKLLAAGADVEARDADGRTALIYAAMFGRNERQLAILDRLIDAGADVNAADSYGRRGMDLAAQLSSVGAVERLAQEGAKITGGYQAMVKRALAAAGRQRG